MAQTTPPIGYDERALRAAAFEALAVAVDDILAGLNDLIDDFTESREELRDTAGLLRTSRNRLLDEAAP